MTLFDTHIHLLAPEWNEPVAQRITSAHQAGIDIMLQPGVRVGDWDALIALSTQKPGVYSAPGVHPLCASEWSDSVADRLRDLCCRAKVVAIGEIGLDGDIEVEPRLQEHVFRAQVEIAIAADLPILLHCRKKVLDLLKILRDMRAERVGGILHGFSGSFEVARDALALGLLIGVGPVLLRNNARKLPELIRQLPAASLVLETDAPDMASTPVALVDIARRLAQLRGWTLEETAIITTANARRLLKIEDRIE